MSDEPQWVTILQDSKFSRNIEIHTRMEKIRLRCVEHLYLVDTVNVSLLPKPTSDEVHPVKQQLPKRSNSSDGALILRPLYRVFVPSFSFTRLKWRLLVFFNGSYWLFFFFCPGLFLDFIGLSWVFTRLLLGLAGRP